MDLLSETAQGSTIPATKRYALVTGANRGIGFEVCKQLASEGIVVLLTDRDEKKGLEAIGKLKDLGISDDNLAFHPLDVAEPDSIASLVDFTRNLFGKLDILVNNAGIGGIAPHPGEFKRAFDLTGNFWKWHDTNSESGMPMGEEVWKGIAAQTCELAEACIKTNYYGARGMAEAFAPLLQSSDSARIVNVSSDLGILQMIPGEWAKGVLADVESLTEERIDGVVNKFLKDFKEGVLQVNGWPTFLSAYTVSKVSMNAYTRILARKHPDFRVNCVHPGYCKTDITDNTGLFTAAEGAESVVRLALLPGDGPSGCFFIQDKISGF